MGKEKSETLALVCAYVHIHYCTVQVYRVDSESVQM